MMAKSAGTWSQSGIALPQSEPLIDLRNLAKAYETAAGELVVLKGINAQFAAGEFVAVIGKSGSGKSTLINMIAGIDRPTSGEILVGDAAVHAFNEGQMAVWRGKNLGIVFQFFQLLPMLTMLENVMLPMDFCNMYSPRERKQRAMTLLERVEMADHATKFPSAVSGGQQQRVAIARALANDPPIILADEPTGNLDSQTAEVIFGLFRDLVSQGKTVLMVTHDTSQAERVDRTLLIVDGEIANRYVAHALPMLSHDQILDATKSLQARQYPSGATIVEQGARNDSFFIVSRGTVKVVLNRANGSEVVVGHIGEGEYFGEIELMRETDCLATVRASGQGHTEVLALDQVTMRRLLDQSDQVRDAISDIARQREAENRAGWGSGGRS